MRKRLERWINGMTDNQMLVLSIIITGITAVCTIFNVSIFILEIKELLR